MDQRRFFNACMSLMNIDMHELLDAGVIEFDVGNSSWKRFNDEPLMFIAKLDDVKRDALWKLLEARQTVKEPRVRFAPARGLTIEQQRSSIPASLYRLGDARLVWVNEGDLCFVGQEMGGEPR